MARSVITSFAVAILFVFAFAPTFVSAQPMSQESEATSAIQEIESVFGQSPESHAWKEYLKLESLRASVQSGSPDAGEQAIRKTLERLASPNPSLRWRPLRRMRERLGRALSNLARRRAQNQSEYVRVAAPPYAPSDAPNISETRQELLNHLSTLDKFLERSGSINASNWKEFLRLNQLIELVQSEDADADEIRELRGRFFRNVAGLETQPVKNVRTKLDEYLDALRASKERKPAENYAKAIRELESSFVSATTTDPRDIARVNFALRRLSWFNQAPSVLESVRSQRLHPNLVVQISADTLRRRMSRPVNQPSDVRDLILGTDIYGRARLTGISEIVPSPSGSRAAFHVLLRGSIASNTVGYNGPATIHSTGCTSVSASMPVFLDTTGLSTGEPSVQCRTKTQINDISAKRRIVERIAWKRASGSQTQAEAIASEHAQTRVSLQFSEEARKRIADANLQLRDKFLLPLERLGENPRLQFSSTNQGVRVHATLASDAQIAAPAEPRASAPIGDVAAQLHESVVINYGERILAGYTLTDTRLETLIKDSGREVPPELQVTEESDPWSISFAENGPVVVAFRDRTVRIAIRLDRLTRGDNVINQPVEIAATYRIEKDAVIRLARADEVNVEFLEKPRSASVATVVRTFLKRKFNNLFRAEIALDPSALAERFPNAKSVSLVDFDANEGWLKTDWRQN